MADSGKRARATDEECENRVEMVIDLLIQGARAFHIKNLLVTSHKISSKQAERYIEKARERLTQLGSQPIGVERACLIERCNQLTGIALREKDYKLLDKTLKSQIRLLQLDYKYANKREIAHDDASPAAQSRQTEMEAALRLLEADESLV